MSSSDLTEHARRNREYWGKELAQSYAENAPQAWAQQEITWGVWEIPERELKLLPDVAGKDVLDLGCGTGYFSAWYARRGARVVGLDVTPEQLDTVRRLQKEFGLEFQLIEASAEQVPLPDASFDLVHSEYGASIWCDPHLWVPEAARLLRPGGQLVFLVNSTIFMLFAPDYEDEMPTDRAVRPYFGMHRFEWPDTEGVEFHLPYGDWIRVLRGNGFVVEALVELQAPEDATDKTNPPVTVEWARRWPSEEIWKARKRA